MVQGITFLKYKQWLWLIGLRHVVDGNMLFERVTLNQSQNVYPITNHKANIRCNQ